MNNPTNSPWGLVDSSKVVAEGIIWCETPSHGGFLLSPERHAEVQKKYPNFQPFAGETWYEEDCDAAIVVSTFTDAFPPGSVNLCQKMIASNQKYYNSRCNL